MIESHSIQLVFEPSEPLDDEQIFAVLRDGDKLMTRLPQEEFNIVYKTVRAASRRGAALIAFSELYEDFEDSHLRLSKILNVYSTAEDSEASPHLDQEREIEDHTDEVMEIFDRLTQLKASED